MAGKKKNKSLSKQPTPSDQLDKRTDQKSACSRSDREAGKRERSASSHSSPARNKSPHRSADRRKESSEAPPDRGETSKAHRSRDRRASSASSDKSTTKSDADPNGDANSNENESVDSPFDDQQRTASATDGWRGRQPAKRDYNSSFNQTSNSHKLQTGNQANRREIISSLESSPYEDNNRRHDNQNRNYGDRKRNKSISAGSDDNEYKTFEFELRKLKHNGQLYKYKFECVEEREMDLFKMDREYALAHCVAEDMGMGAGIAVQFRRDFQRVPFLMSQNQRTGGLAILNHKDRFIYYLVTKAKSQGKPTNRTLFQSLYKLRAHAIENHVQKIAMPRIGCGLDRLEWDESEDTPKTRAYTCTVTNETYPIAEIESGTIILFFSNESGTISEVMRQLDVKFNFLTSFKHATKTPGQCYWYQPTNNYKICGCILSDDAKKFQLLQSCCNDINKKNGEFMFEYVGFQAFDSKDDPVIMDKVINILRHGLKYVALYVCWTVEMFEANQRASWSNHGGRYSGGIQRSEVGGTTQRDPIRSEQKSVEIERKAIESNKISEQETHSKPKESTDLVEMMETVSVEKIRFVSELDKSVPKVYFVTASVETLSGNTLGKCPYNGFVLDQHKIKGDIVPILAQVKKYFAIIKEEAKDPIERSVISSVLLKIKNVVFTDNLKSIAIPQLIEVANDEIKEFYRNELETTFADINNIDVLIYKDTAQIHTGKIVRTTYNLSNIRKKSIILYFTAVQDGYNPLMDMLDTKFKIKDQFLNAPKSIGSIIDHPISDDYHIFGCIVKETETDNDLFNYKEFESCINKIGTSIKNPSNWTSFGFQAFKSYERNRNVIAIVRNLLPSTDVIVCCPNHLINFYPNTV